MNSSVIDTILAVVWPADSFVARGLVVLIFLMFAAAMVCTLWHSVRIAAEGLAVARTASIVRSWRKHNLTANAGQTSEAARYPRLSPEELETKAREIRKAAGAKSHVGRLIEAIQILRTHGMKINLAVLQQVVEREEATRIGVNVPQVVANFAVMLGILGTFWGLGNMVSAIVGALPDTSSASEARTWAESAAEIRRVLLGMRTAFSTSLVGMACSIAAGLAGVFLSSLQEGLLQKLEAFAVGDLLPATVPTLDDESLLEQVGAQLERAFEFIYDIAAQNRQSLAELSAAQTTFRSIIEEGRAITHVEAGRDLTGVLEAVLGSNAAVQSLVAHLPRLTDAVERGQRDGVASRSVWNRSAEEIQALTAAVSTPDGAVQKRIALAVALVILVSIAFQIVVRLP